MNHKFATKGSIGALATYFLIGFYLILKYRNDYTSEEKTLYLIILFTYIVTAGLLVLAKIQYDLYIFEPLTFVGILYIAIYVYRPMVDLYNDELSVWGINVLNGGIKATVIFLLAFIAIFFGYYGAFRHNYIKQKKVGVFQNTNEQTCEYYNFKYVLFGWSICFILCIVCMISEGISLQYIFSLASAGEKTIDESNTALLFLANFVMTMITLWMMIWIQSGKKVTKVIITLLTLIYLIVRNSRIFLLILVGAPITYYYTKKKKSPNMAYIVIVGTLLLAIFAWMQVNRGNIQAGRSLTGWGDGGFTIDKLFSPFDSDLTTYKPFYGMVVQYPKNYEYEMGRSYLYTFVLFIPRILWKGKPANPASEIVENSLNYQARISGQAYSGIAEFYANFGVLGTIVLSFLFGKLLSKCKKLYQEPTPDRLIIYSILYPFLFQLVARGNFAGNFYAFLFAIIPFLCKRMMKIFWGGKKHENHSSSSGTTT